MKLKTKISLIILMMWAIMATLFYYGSQVIILNSYVSLEDQMIRENLDRTEAAFQQTIDSLEANVKDWSIRDDTYQYMHDKNKKYLKSTLNLSSLQSLNIDIIMLFDKNGHLVTSLTINNDRNKTIPLPSGLLEILEPTNKILSNSTPESISKGMLSIPSGILLMASHSIITSEGEGSSAGTLVMCKYVTNTVLANIEHFVKASVTLYRLPGSLNNPEIIPIYKKLNNNALDVLAKSNEQLLGYRFINDIYKNHIAILKVEIPRRIYQIGIETTHYSNIILFIYSVAITILLWLLLQYLVVKRIEGLSKHIGRMGNDDKMLTKLIENVSDEVSSVVTLYHQATHDPLTGLANRNLLYQAFNAYVADLHNPEQKIVILYIDLDHFKRINDTLGHDVGDQLLITSAKRLTASLRGNDLASRLGGDEFVVMLVDIEKTQIESITSRIFKSINRPITYDNHEIYLSCSMGVCVYPNDGTSIEKLIKLADLALYHAKENGRNHYQFYSESLNADLNESHQKEIELQRALDENQLTLYYQPIYDLKTKQIVSMEALIRWHHPTQGLLGADEIIPFAESSELIYPISDWVLKTVCAQSKSWQDKSLPIVPIAVNISAVQLKEISISEKIITYIREAGIKPSHLEIEITETSFIDITPRIISELNNLKAAGIMLTIDDFGTGYAGLGYLKKLPVGKLKIDQSFIRDIQTDPDDKAITLAIIAIAHQLNLKVTAEGVENVEQYNFMCYHQVDEVQGYFLNKPMSVEDCEKLLTGTETKPIS